MRDEPEREGIDIDERERCAIMRRMDRRSQAESRKYRRQEIDDAVRAARALKAAGFSPRSLTVGGQTFELGKAKEAPAPASENELDKWLERHPEYARPRPSQRH